MSASTLPPQPQPVDLVRKEISLFIPMSGVVDSTFNVYGELRDVATSITGDYVTLFTVGNQHAGILVNSVVGGGDIVVSGTVVSETTAVPVVDTETITIDTTAGQQYQTNKKWLEITNVDVSGTTTLNYDIFIVGYLDFGNTDFNINGYRAEYRSSGGSGDVGLRIRKIQDDGVGKMSVVDVENIGIDSTGGGGDIVDDLRTGLDDRSYSYATPAWLNDTMHVFKQLDFDTFFSGDENVCEGSTKAEGLIVDFLGKPSGGISNVDYCTLTLFYT